MYKNFTDEELIYMIRKNDEEAEITLIKRYKNLVKSKCRSYFLIGSQSEDLVQEGMIGLIKSIRQFKNDKGASFSTFANLCITRQIQSAIRLANGKKYDPLNKSFSLNAINKVNDFDVDLEYIDYLESNIQNPEAYYISNENKDSILKLIDNELSKFEKKVLEGFLEGKSYVELSIINEKTEKSIDNAIQRIRAKLRKKLK